MNVKVSLFYVHPYNWTMKTDNKLPQSGNI